MSENSSGWRSKSPAAFFFRRDGRYRSSSLQLPPRQGGPGRGWVYTPPYKLMPHPSELPPVRQETNGTDPKRAHQPRRSLFGVLGLDMFLESVNDYPAFQFHRLGQKAVFQGEILRQEDELFGDLITTVFLLQKFRNPVADQGADFLPFHEGIHILG